MFDFRYHALSLIAVLLALAIGLTLGVALGDEQLVTNAGRDIEGSLREDIRAEQARNDALTGRNDQLAGQLDARERFEDDVYPLLVGGRLDGQRIGVVALGDLPDDTARQVREAVEPAGGRLVSVSVLRVPPDLEGLASRLSGTRFARLAQRPRLITPLARRLGRELVSAGSVLRAVGPAPFSQSSGPPRRLDGIVLARAPQAELEPDQQAIADAFEDGLVQGIQSRRNVSLVGVEQSTTDPSQIEWFQDHGLTSVDNIDELAGRVALVFALAGAEGTYGTKSTADGQLPRVGSAPGD